MQLPKLTLVPPKIQSGDLFPALELVMSDQALEQAIAATDSREKRKRILPTYVVVALVIAMNLWSADSILDVFKNLVAGLVGQRITQGCRWGTPNRSSISGARKRVGSRVMTHLFEKLARPLATLQTPGAFLNGLRWMAIDGTLFDLPDTDSNALGFRLSRHQKRHSCCFPKSQIGVVSGVGNSPDYGCSHQPL